MSDLSHFEFLFFTFGLIHFFLEVLLKLNLLSFLAQKWLPFIHQLLSLLHDFSVCFLNPSNML